VRERVTFVIHDWGSALGFDWSKRHPEAVKGIAFMEAIVAPQGWTTGTRWECVKPWRRYVQTPAKRWSCRTTGEPADVTAIATEYADWLGTSNVPKLFLKVEPGAILALDRLVNLVRGWPALTEKTVAGIHFVQEDSPDEIGQAIAGWMATLA